MKKIIEEEVLEEPTELGLNMRAHLAEFGGRYPSKAAFGRAHRLTQSQQKTLDRVIGFEKISLVSLLELARAFRVEPWMLLIPGFDIENEDDRAYWEGNFRLFRRTK